jgi:hypothetical protein
MSNLSTELWGLIIEMMRQDYTIDHYELVSVLLFVNRCFYAVTDKYYVDMLRCLRDKHEEKTIIIKLNNIIRTTSQEILKWHHCGCLNLHYSYTTEKDDAEEECTYDAGCEEGVVIANELKSMLCRLRALNLETDTYIFVCHQCSRIVIDSEEDPIEELQITEESPNVAYFCQECVLECYTCRYRYCSAMHEDHENSDSHSYNEWAYPVFLKG